MLSLFKPQLMLKQHALGVSIDDMAERYGPFIDYVRYHDPLQQLAISSPPPVLAYLQHAHGPLRMAPDESDKLPICLQADDGTGLQPGCDICGIAELIVAMDEIEILHAQPADAASSGKLRRQSIAGIDELPCKLRLLFRLIPVGEFTEERI